jgi:FKBP-type peptidyl-prolyl cis-trans isomerase FkpA
MASTFRLTRLLATAVLSLAIVACIDGTAPDPGSDPATETYSPDLEIDLTQMTKMSYALYVEDVVVGTGVRVDIGSTISVNYAGFLVNGTRFTPDATDPFSFVLGVGYILDGWNQGLVGMKVGGVRKLVIGSRLAFGPKGSGTVPAQSTVVYSIELVSAR